MKIQSLQLVEQIAWARLAAQGCGVSSFQSFLVQKLGSLLFDDHAGDDKLACRGLQMARW